MHYIKTYKNPSNSRNKKIYFADFEALIHKDIHYPCVYDLYNQETNFHKSLAITGVCELNLEKKSRELIENFIEECFDQAKMWKNSDVYVYFHNLGRYDSFFIIKYANLNKYTLKTIVRDNVFYQLKVSDGEYSVIFRDSYLLFPAPLQKMTLTFFKESDEIEKNEFDFSQNLISNYKTMADVLKLGILQYCQNDTYILSKSFNKYREYINSVFDIDITNTLTLSALSFNIFRKNYYDVKNTPIAHADGNCDSFIRKSYRGGVVDIYKPVLNSGYHYDVNSLYPYVMSKYEMPTGLPKYGIADDKFNISSFFGFIEVDVYCPNDISIPFLTYNDPQKGLISPTGIWTDTYFSKEIEYALSLGYTFKYKKFYKFDKGVVFNKFVNNLYQIRVNNKENALNQIAKLILNSLYGRFGMKNETETCSILSNKDLNGINHILKTYRINSYFTFDDKVVIRNSNNPLIKNIDINEIDPAYKKSNATQKNLNTAVQIASAVTAYARIEMHNYKVRYNTYYSDTDSLFTDIEISKSEVGDSLGLMKLVGNVSKALFLAPKLYYCIYDNGTQIIRGKGLENSILDIKSFDELYKNKDVSFSINRNFIRNFKTYLIGKINRVIKITGKFDKRVKIFTYINNELIWSNTEPLNIKIDKTQIPEQAKKNIKHK